YATDAKSDSKVKVLDVFPESTHAPILYPIAITASSTNKDAPSFLTYLKTASAQSVFEAQGFKVLLNY
ncbi:MAG TPA: substrate-binding domain-containing protein, partial [Methyloceanibacter sp.]